MSDLTQETTQQKDTTHGFVPVATRTRVAARRGEKIEQAPQAEKSTAKEEAKSRIRTPLSEAILMKLVTIMDFSETRSNRDLIDVLGENMLDKNGKLLIPYQLFGALAGEMAYLSGRVYLHNRGKEKNVLTPDEEGAWSVMQGIIADFRTIERRESNPQADAVEPNSITRQEVLLIFNKRLEDIFGEYGYRVTIPSAKKAASHIGDQGKGVSEDITPGITRERAIAVFNLAAEDATPDELQAALNYYESLSDVDMRKFDEAVAQAAEVIKAQTLQEETLSQVAESSGGKAGFPDQEFDVIEVEVTVPPEVVARAKELSFEQTRDYLNRPEAISPEDVEAAVYWYNHVATAQERAALGRSRRVEIVSDVQGEVQEDDSAKARRLRGNDGQLDKHIDELFEEFAKKNFTPQSSLTSGMLQKTFLWGPRMVDGDLAQVLGQSRDSGREYSFWEALALGYVYNYGEGLAPSLKRKFVAKYIELRYAEWLKRRQRRT